MNDSHKNEILNRLAATIESRKGGDAESSYVARLLNGPEDALLKKVGEEATETVLAAKGGTFKLTDYDAFYEAVESIPADADEVVICDIGTDPSNAAKFSNVMP